MNDRETAEQGQYLGLFIGEEEYAIGILRVREILQFESITRVPGTPRSVRGVINVRGSVVPVVDLAVKFGLPESVVTRRTCIVILEVQAEGEATVMGVMADSVSQVVELAAYGHPAAARVRDAGPRRLRRRHGALRAQVHPRARHRQAALADELQAAAVSPEEEAALPPALETSAVAPVAQHAPAGEP